MKGLTILALSFLILSYVALICMLIYDNELQEFDFPYIFIIWGIGIINLVLNVINGIKKEFKSRILTLMIVSGLVWAFPPLLFTIFGIPFLAIYLIIGSYFHGKELVNMKTG